MTIFNAAFTKVNQVITEAGMLVSTLKLCYGWVFFLQFYTIQSGTFKMLSDGNFKIYLTPVKTQLLQYKLTQDLMLFYHSNKIKAYTYGRDIKQILFWCR